MKNRISQSILHKKHKGQKAREKAAERKIEKASERFVNSKPISIFLWAIVIGILGGIGYSLFLLGDSYGV